MFSWPQKASSPWTSTQYRAFPSYTRFNIYAEIDKIAIICSLDTRNNKEVPMLRGTEREMEARAAQTLVLVDKFVVH